MYSKNASEMKDMVYDFSIAGQKYFAAILLVSSLDAASLGVSAVLSALFDNPNSIPDQIALAVTASPAVSYIVLLKLKDPYSNCINGQGHSVTPPWGQDVSRYKTGSDIVSCLK